ncbi:MAG: SIS domain-containing protein [Clostridia bacterium]|nr:SIS domain-containing protein [Clostridia bacterium]
MATLEPRVWKHIDALMKRYPPLETIREQITDAYLIMQESFAQGGKLLVAGNGGSAADSEHIVGELMKRFVKPRPVQAAFAEKLIAVDPARGAALAQSLERTLTAIPLVGHEALSTAFMNDVGGADVYAQQLLGYGRPGDVFLGISTSGRSENILRAIVTAKALDLRVIGLTGRTGGQMKDLCDVTVQAPETETYLIQEYHLPIYHCWCLMLEEYFFGA